MTDPGFHTAPSWDRIGRIGGEPTLNPGPAFNVGTGQEEP